MSTSYGYDQDAEPPTPDGHEPDVDEVGADKEPGSDEPGSHPHPDPGEAADQAGSDS